MRVPRRSKIKCVNSGVPPCVRCDRSRISGCDLTRPQRTSTAAQRAKSSRQPGHASSAQPRRHVVPPVSASSLAQEPVACLDDDHVDRHLCSLPRRTILRVFRVFSNKFRELPFLHFTSLVKDEPTPSSPEVKALLGAVLTITRLQPEVSNASWADGLLTSVQYAEYVRDALSKSMLGPPKIEVVQTLLIMALYD